MSDLPLANRVIVVVGGTTGLGLAGARACVAAGARVVVVGRSAQSATAAVDALGSAARSLVADASHPETADRAIDLALAEHGGFHGLYHVAGGSGRRAGDGALHEITDDGWDATMRLNLTSAFHSNRAAARRLLERGAGGSVLNMSSVLAYSPAPRHFSTHAYATAKAAIIGLTTAAAARYAKDGIRFNAVAPAVVETPMATRATHDDEIRRYLAARQPLHERGIGRADELDAAVVYFLSDQSRYTTGQVLAIDGGWSVSDGV